MNKKINAINVLSSIIKSHKYSFVSYIIVCMHDVIFLIVKYEIFILIYTRRFIKKNIFFFYILRIFMTVCFIDNFIHIINVIDI